MKYEYKFELSSFSLCFSCTFLQRKNNLKVLLCRYNIYHGTINLFVHNVFSAKIPKGFIYISLALLLLFFFFFYILNLIRVTLVCMRPWGLAAQKRLCTLSFSQKVNAILSLLNTLASDLENKSTIFKRVLEI